jgi:hypothetical protein
VRSRKASNLVSFRIASVPRSFLGYHDGQISQIPVTPELLSSALAEELGTAPTQVVETKNSIEASYTFSATWIARFPSDVTSLPRSPLLFGARASVRVLPKKISIVQCSRCLSWHNARTCARLPRCRLCGSTTHVEEGHTACSDTTHSCPPRCLHCHGPHPADSLECLLRPKPQQTALTKQQKAQIRQSCSAARLRIKAANCGTSPRATEPSPNPLITNNTTQPMEVEAASSSSVLATRPSTPPTSQTLLAPPTTNQSLRFSLLSPSEQLLPGKRLFSRPSQDE